MSEGLKIADGLTLPLNAVTETFAILAKRGSGKTYTAGVLAEELLGANLPIVVLDPVGAWWGLRSSADGKHPGLPISILGGDHGDVPLEATAGKLLAELVASEGTPLVLDLSAFSKGDMARFVTDFAETLYRRNRKPLHLIVDEADAFAPQKPRPEQARMLGALDDIVRRGRQRGLGVTLVTQRSAVLNKDVLTQCEVLIALRTPHPNDRKPIQDWIAVHGTDDQHREMMASLAGLARGEAWVLSAAWLDVFRRVQIRKKWTFDSSRTPEAGESRPLPKVLAAVDLARLQTAMRETVEKAAANDPAKLRARVAELESALRKAQSAAPKIERVEVPVVGDAEMKAMAAASSTAREVAESLQATADKLAALVRHLAPSRPSLVSVTRPTIRAVSRGPTLSTDGLSAYGRSLVETMARRHPMRLSRPQISTLSGRSPRSSAFHAAMAEVLRLGLAEESGGLYSLTSSGLGLVDVGRLAPQSQDDIVETWRAALPGYERDLFDALVAAYPQSCTRTELAELTERSQASSAFHAAISSLAKNGLAVVESGSVRVSATLMETSR